MINDDTHQKRILAQEKITVGSTLLEHGRAHFYKGKCNLKVVLSKPETSALSDHLNSKKSSFKLKHQQNQTFIILISQIALIKPQNFTWYFKNIFYFTNSFNFFFLFYQDSRFCQELIWNM